MGRLVLRRLLATIPVLLLVTAGVFALIHLTPGDPIDVMMAESVDASVKANLRAELGLDRPLYIQYAAWMGRLLRGDLGHSIRNREPVIENVGRRIRPSLQLAGLAMAIAEGAMTREHVHAELGELVSGARPGRANESQITLYKSVGVAVQDAAAAAMVLESARKGGVGRTIDL